ncbi:MAG: porin, partial [Myxococcales bacterium]
LFKWAGFSLLSQVLYRRAMDEVLTGTRNNAPFQERTRSGWGWFAQAGYLFTEVIEVAARYSDLRPLRGSEISREREVGGGLNLYFSRHDLKLQTDYFYLAGDPGSPGRHQVRSQLQLYF